MKTLLPALLLLTAPIAFAADDISYTYAEVDYLVVEPEVDGLDVDGDDGLGLSGSIHVTDHFYLFGNYQTGEVDGGVFNDIDVDLFDLGLGWRLGPGPGRAPAAIHYVRPPSNIAMPPPGRPVQFIVFQTRHLT